jgi:hypothetical protein
MCEGKATWKLEKARFPSNNLSYVNLAVRQNLIYIISNSIENIFVFDPVKRELHRSLDVLEEFTNVTRLLACAGNRILI